jgi:hypothetical protein
MKVTDPVVHYVQNSSGGPDYPQLCRNAIVTGTSPSGDILSLAVFDPDGLRFRQDVYHAPPPDPGPGTWHHLAECVHQEEPGPSLRERITDELRARGNPGLNVRQLARFTGQGSLAITHDEIRRELHRMQDEKLAGFLSSGHALEVLWVLTS